MNITDPIADMLTRLRNATAAKHSQVVMPSSRMKEAIAKVLRDEGYIAGYEVVPTGKPQPDLRITLLYTGEREPGIRGIRRISKPGLRVYTKRADIPRPMSGLGLAVLSTPRGVMAGRQAYAQQLGGEVLAYVW